MLSNQARECLDESCCDRIILNYVLGNCPRKKNRDVDVSKTPTCSFESIHEYVHFLNTVNVKYKTKDGTEQTEISIPVTIKQKSSMV